MPVLTVHPETQQVLPKQPSPGKRPWSQPNQPKIGARRASKPIINWFQRKLTLPVSGRVKGKGTAGTAQRVASSPLPAQNRTEARRTVSLNGEEDARLSESSVNIDDESTWSPTSALEADEDASLRPIPPSSPPSPSPSRSSSSYLSDPRTFKSIAASTKPTTVLSVDLNGNGMAHIAQAPLTPSQVNRFHARNASTGTNPNMLGSAAPTNFAAIPSTPDSSRPPSSQNAVNLSGTLPIPSVQAPLHTAHHPRNNPRPSSPPLDNASVLTLASSAFALPGLRTPGWTSAPPSALGGGDSISHFGGSGIYADVEEASNLADEDRLDEGDASVRALRPRSSRRGSWESEASRWSARIQTGSGTPLTRERSVWTANSVKTGGRSVDIEDTEPSETTAEDIADQPIAEQPELDTGNLDDEQTPAKHAEAALDTPQAERKSSSTTVNLTTEVERPSKEDNV